MTAIDKVRSFAGSREPDVAVIRDGITYGDARELLQEIDLMRADAAETREACARICDERSRMHKTIHDATWIRALEASDCAAAIRAGGEP